MTTAGDRARVPIGTHTVAGQRRIRTGLQRAAVRRTDKLTGRAQTAKPGPGRRSPAARPQNRSLGPGAPHRPKSHPQRSIKDRDDTQLFWHWGDNGIFRAFMVGEPARRRAIAVFTNAHSGAKVYQRIIGSVGLELDAFLWV